MSDYIDITWVKIPSFPKNQLEAVNDGLVAFNSFVPKIVFDVSKNFWEGSITMNDKKVGVYRVELVEELLEKTFLVSLDGVKINKSTKGFVGKNAVNRLLNLSQNSNNQTIAKIGNKQRQLIIFNDVKRDLWRLFDKSEVVEGYEDYDNGEWTRVQPTGSDKIYDFNLTYGLLHYVEERTEGGKSIIVHKLSKLKHEEDLKDLLKYVTELKKYGKNVTALIDFEHQSSWKENVVPESFVSKVAGYQKN